jgi:transposase
MLHALMEGIDDPEALADLAHAKLGPKHAALVQALEGQLSSRLRFLVQQHLEHWHELDARIAAFDRQIAAELAPFEATVVRLDGIPGVGRQTAEVLLAEIGPDVSRFPTSGHLASWAGVSPGNRQSGGKRKRARTRHGNPWLKGALVEAAWAASHCRSGHFPARYRRLVPRRGRKRALVALAHTLLVDIYYMLDRGTDYQDLGGDYYDRRDRARREHYAITFLERLGYRVDRHPTPDQEAA